MSKITRELIEDRTHHTAALFGVHFPLHLEPTIYAFAEHLSPDYRGGYWLFYTLSHGGFYMAPDDNGPFSVRSENGSSGVLSADALGITACLYAYSHLSFSKMLIADTFAAQYHRLREYALDHAEAGAIMAAID